jgi:hypothetical protein
MILKYNLTRSRTPGRPEADLESSIERLNNSAVRM